MRNVASLFVATHAIKQRVVNNNVINSVFKRLEISLSTQHHHSPPPTKPSRTATSTTTDTTSNTDETDQIHAGNG